MRALPLLVLWPLLATPRAHASETEQSYTEDLVELRINGQTEGPTLLVRRDADGALLIKASDLAGLRLTTPEQGVVLIDGEPHFRIEAVPGATLRFDRSTQSADLELPASAFVATVSSPTAAARPSPTVSPGAFVNYSLSTQRVEDESEHGAILEQGFFGAPGVVTNSMVAQDADGRRTATRLETTWTRDFPERLSTLRLGDAISAPGAWGRAVRFGGLQFGTNFGTQPTLVTAPLLAAQGEAVVPSTVDVFINGRAVASEAVPPGPFSIEQLPAVTGAGELQVVVTDALGRQQVVAQPYYTGPTLLRAGLSAFSAELGVFREDYALRSNQYGDLVAAGTFRRGITDALTAEVHGEAQAGGPHALGVDTAWQVGTLGVISATAAAGSNADGTGWLAGGGFERGGRRVHLFVRTQYASERFVQLGSTTTLQQPRQRSFGGVGFDLARMGSLQLACGRQSFWNAGGVTTLGLSYSRTLGPYGFLNLYVNHSQSASAQTDLALTWTMPFGDRRSASSSLAYRPDAQIGDTLEATATLQQNLPAGTGSGYHVTASTSEDAELSYAYQGRAGLAGVEYSRRNRHDGWRATALGGLAITGTGVLPTRWVDQSFAVVDVADYAGLMVYVENQPIARTDRKGRVLLDRLRAYETNEVSLDPTELPLDASLSTASMALTPAWRSGAVVRFPIVRANAATFRLVRADGQPVPAGALVEARGGQATVALDGLVYLIDAAGHVEATASWPGHRCDFAFDRPDDGDPMPDVGTVACEAAIP
jgi:outer membrane usher protein